MKKIIGLTIAALLVLGIVGAGTWAFFQDTEVAQTTLSAGTLDLKVDGGDGIVTFEMSDLKPGASDFGECVLNNAGSLPGILSVASGIASNTDGTPPEFQTDGTGDLGGAVTIAIFIDVDESGNWTDGDVGLANTGDTYTFADGLQYGSVDSYDSLIWAEIGSLAAGASQNFHVEWEFAETDVDQNICQGDSISIDFTFTLDQEP